MSSQFQSYKQYLDNFDVASNELSKQHKKITEFEVKNNIAKRSATASTQLAHLLEFPMSRLRYYALTFRKIQKFSQPDASCNRVLDDAVTVLVDLNEYLSLSRRASEHLHKLSDLVKKVSGLDRSFVKPGRLLLREGMLSKVNPKGKVQNRLFVLTSDTLIWAEKKGLGSNGYNLRGKLPLNSALVNSLPDNETLRHYKFQVVRMDTQKNYTLFADTAKQKERWFKELQAAINKLFEQSKQQKNTLDEPVQSKQNLPDAAFIDRYNFVFGSIEEITTQWKQENEKIEAQLDSIQQRLDQLQGRKRTKK
eukprot:CAMPEP_0201547508 /NCGR_PEP_ID=MMETSP0173_2-20130828/3984_1 /ASSEMBLY_ACC=CAM_ASM_000268 /TAXON_ID=218659 /ORGANISM="Vexillifera sp., Strain DIVA3 564/2" /LENGTH=307 /DNA_ID=CAMNT_0047956577 /DNA_START=284 /DNA_END=1207 /DNA_ORIENTATION=+